MHLSIRADELDPLLDAMRDLAHAGRGWINLVPEGVERHELAATRSIPGMIFGRIGGRGAPVPKITWTAPTERRRGTEPAQVGIEHPAGSRASRQLAAAGHPIPTGWSLLQDHAIRGLVVVPGPDATEAEVISWALHAAATLAPAAVGEWWHARVFEP